tara:strand:- start:82 stop:276 length:195 start_codon:yes stop_codon:yes gene_type:complete
VGTERRKVMSIQLNEEEREYLLAVLEDELVHWRCRGKDRSSTLLLRFCENLIKKIKEDNNDTRM